MDPQVINNLEWKIFVLNYVQIEPRHRITWDQLLKIVNGKERFVNRNVIWNSNFTGLVEGWPMEIAYHTIKRWI